jgi:hypothetical protein
MGIATDFLDGLGDWDLYSLHIILLDLLDRQRRNL